MIISPTGKNTTWAYKQPAHRSLHSLLWPRMQMLQSLQHGADPDRIMKNFKVLGIRYRKLLSISRVVTQKGIPTIILLSQGFFTPLDLLIGFIQTLLTIPRDAISTNQSFLLGAQLGLVKRFGTSGGLYPDQNQYHLR